MCVRTWACKETPQFRLMRQAVPSGLSKNLSIEWNAPQPAHGIFEKTVSPARGRWGMFLILPGSMVKGGGHLNQGLAIFRSPVSSLEPGAVVFASVPGRKGAAPGEVCRAQAERSQHNLGSEHK